jgi:hypothetical protein
MAMNVNIEEIENTSRQESNKDYDRFVYIENQHDLPSHSQSTSGNARSSSASPIQPESNRSLSAHSQNEAHLSTSSQHVSTANEDSNKRVSSSDASLSPPTCTIADPQRKNDPTLRNKPSHPLGYHQSETNQVIDTDVYNSSSSSPIAAPYRYHNPSNNDDNPGRLVPPGPAHTVRNNVRDGGITNNVDMFPSPPPSHATHPTYPRHSSPSPPAYTASVTPSTSLPPGTYMIESQGRFCVVEDPAYEEALHDQQWQRREGDEMLIGRNATIPLSMIFWLFGWLFPLLWIFGIYWMRSPIPRERYWAYMCAMNIIILITVIIIVIMV